MTERELTHLYATKRENVRKLFQRINYLELKGDEPMHGYGPRQYDLRSVWEHYRLKPAELAAISD